jgi:hypothetical protein
MATRKVDKHNMTNNKQQTEINAVEYLDKVNQFAKENNTGKPKQQTAVDSLKDFFKQYDLAHSSLDYYEFKIPMHIFDLKFQETKEMEKEQIAKAFDDGDYNYHYSRKTGDDFENGKEYYQEVYGKEI